MHVYRDDRVVIIVFPEIGGGDAFSVGDRARRYRLRVVVLCIRGGR
jgi:hypothetical protein